MNNSFLNNAQSIRAILLKLFLSILIVYVNKSCFTDYSFPNITLTAFQLIATFICICIGSLFGLVKIKRLPIFDIIISSTLLLLFAGLTNLSIEYNSIIVTQYFKLLIVPLSIIPNYLCNKRATTSLIKIGALVCLLNYFTNQNYFVGLYISLTLGVQSQNFRNEFWFVLQSKIYRLI